MTSKNSSQVNQVTDTEIADSHWNSLYKIGGTAALIVVLVALIEIIVTFSPGRRAFRARKRDRNRLVYALSRQLVHGTAQPWSIEYRDGRFRDSGIFCVVWRPPPREYDVCGARYVNLFHRGSGLLRHEQGLLHA